MFASGDGNLVYNGVGAKTGVSMDGRTYSYHPRLVPFTVDPNNNDWYDYFFSDNKYVDQEFIDKLRKNQQ